MATSYLALLSKLIGMDKIILTKAINEAVSGSSSNDSYTKEQTDSLLDDKADKSSVYTTTEVNNLLDTKASTSDVSSLNDELDTVFTSLETLKNSTLVSNNSYEPTIAFPSDLTTFDFPTVRIDNDNYTVDNTDVLIGTGGIYSIYFNIQVTNLDNNTEGTIYLMINVNGTTVFSSKNTVNSSINDSSYMLIPYNLSLAEDDIITVSTNTDSTGLGLKGYELSIVKLESNE